MLTGEEATAINCQQDIRAALVTVDTASDCSCEKLSSPVW